MLSQPCRLGKLYQNTGILLYKAQVILSYYTQHKENDTLFVRLDQISVASKHTEICTPWIFFESRINQRIKDDIATL